MIFALDLIGPDAYIQIIREGDTEMNTKPTATQIEAGNNAIIAEAIANVQSGATRTSTKFLHRGTVNARRDGRNVRVMVNTGHSYALGTAGPDGAIKWDDIPMRRITSRLVR